MLIPLSGKKAAGRCAIIDDSDYELIFGYRWYVSSERASGVVYARTGGKPQFYMHRLITGYALTDHINGNGLDNRRINLREANPKENARNRKPWSGCSSQFKGVSWNKANEIWRAAIYYDGKIVHLGCFEDEQDAARAYDAAARDMYGEFCWLNFPQ